MLYSFDVFDTCITRIFLRPIDLFYQLFKNLNPNLTPEDIYDLVRLRIKAESEARSLSQKEDITLQDIYDRLDIAYYDLAPQTVKQAELDLEFQSLRPIKEIQIKIESLRHQGHKIIFISDMYLPTEHIQKILIHNQIAQSNDPIYVSGDISLTKATGNLFRYVLKSENILPKQLHHTGDNIYSDIVIPQNLGIKTTRFTSIQPTRYEEKAFNETIAPVEIRSQIAGISRAVRLQETDPSRNNREIVTIAANVIAPLLTSYVTWVLQDAKERGIEKLYFVSRDGQILLKIAQQFSYHYPSIELRYLYGSRQAWFLPSITEVNPKALDWLIRDGQSTNLEHILKKLNINIKDVHQEIKKYGFTHTDIEIDLSTSDEFWKMIQSSYFSKLIQENANRAKSTTTAYFLQEELHQGTCALVDMGWSLKSQRAFRSILKLVDHTLEIQGYYFGISTHACTSQEAGRYFSFLQQDLPESKHERSIFSYINIIDQLFTTAQHPLVIGYQETDNSIRPQFKNTEKIPNEQDFISTVHKTTIQYSTEYSHSSLFQTQESHLTLKSTALNNVIVFFKKPSRIEVIGLNSLTVSDDQNESRKRKIIQKINVLNLIYWLTKKLKIQKQKSFELELEWKEASLMISHPIVILLYDQINNLLNLTLTRHFYLFYYFLFTLKNKKH